MGQIGAGGKGKAAATATAMWENCALERAQSLRFSLAALAFTQQRAGCETFGAGPVHCDCLLYKMKIPPATNVCPSTGTGIATSSPMHWTNFVHFNKELKIFNWLWNYCFHQLKLIASFRINLNYLGAILNERFWRQFFKNFLKCLSMRVNGPKPGASEANALISNSLLKYSSPFSAMAWP